MTARPPDDPGRRPGISLDLPVPARVLAVGAHPDDIEFACGGTVAKWAAAGADVHLLILTDGSKGTWDPGADPAELRRTRETEARAAARILGAADVHFLGVVDGELDSGLPYRGRVCEVIRTVRPDVVLGHDPWKRYRIHPDHRHAGWLTVEAIFAARDPHFFSDQGPGPHRPDALLLFEAEAIDHVEDIDATVHTKVDALLAHTSQWRSTRGIEPDDHDGAAAFRARRVDIASGLARDLGVASRSRAVEAFKLVDEL